jgi:hypothetical protein
MMTFDGMSSVTPLKRLIACAGLVMVSACQSERLLANVSGIYPLRRVRWDVSLVIEVPGTLQKTAEGDSTNIVAGTFRIDDECNWSGTWDRVTVIKGIESERRTFGQAGVCRATRQPNGVVELDLYSGSIVPANLITRASIACDTVYFGGFRYAR